jgi:AhpD family alkylhydroperoxidase
VPGSPQSETDPLPIVFIACFLEAAVAVTTRCDGCITFHTEAALKAGASKQEIAESLGVAMVMNAGAALIYSLRAMDAVAAQTGGK